MNLLNFLSEITTYSNYALIGLADVVHITHPTFEVVTLEAVSPPAPLYRLLYIHKGSIQLRMDQTDKKTAVLPTGSLLLSSCENELRFRVTQSDLESWIFYLHGNALPYYKEVMDSSDLPFVPAHTSKATEFIHNLIQLNKSKTPAEELLVNNLVTALFTEWTAADALSRALPTATPAYLLAVKDDFDKNYREDFSLDDLAARHKVNKYRLCKEFTKYFQLSPIKYLNLVRIQNAGLLLVSTDMLVGEIGAAVGIENPNHFIRLFKAQMGMTPLEYRQRLI